MVYDSRRDVSVVIGGLGPAPSTLFEWDGSVWRTIAPAVAPGPQFGPVVGEDPLGGVLHYSNYPSEGLWHWDGSVWTQRAASSIGQRNFAGMALDPLRSRIVLFGGISFGVPSGDLDETWEWDGTAWTRSVVPAAPAARSYPAMAFDGLRGEIVLAGGMEYPRLTSPQVPYSDTWSYDGGRWTRLATTGAYTLGALVYDERRGRLVNIFRPSETREWVGGQWVQRAATLPTNARCDRAFGVAAYHRGNARVVALVPCILNSPTPVETWRYGATSPATADSYGSGCAGTAGVPELRPAPGAANLPWAGSTFRMAVGSSLPLPTAAIFALGFRDDAWSGGPLPAPLSAYGMPGCQLLVEPLALAFRTATAPSFDLAVPAAGSLVGRVVFSQAAVFDAAANAAGLVTSNGLRLTIGGY